jgi:hypothetical protein
VDNLHFCILPNGHRGSIWSHAEKTKEEQANRLPNPSVRFSFLHEHGEQRGVDGVHHGVLMHLSSQSEREGFLRSSTPHWARCIARQKVIQKCIGPLGGSGGRRSSVPTWQRWDWETTVVAAAVP